jgi:hypothetical protein
VQPAAGDCGGALGAALTIYHLYADRPRTVPNTSDGMIGCYLGPEFDDGENADAAQGSWRALRHAVARSITLLANKQMPCAVKHQAALFLGMGSEEHTIPWSKLTYDTSLGGYRTDITESQLRGAPAFSRGQDWDWNDRSREQELHDHYRAPYYWGV